jgi:pimeloyl-ACP methyl ester carboxylesterase
MPNDATPVCGSVTCAHPGGWHQTAYRRWTPGDEPRAEVICLHGFSRSGADFERLAEDLLAMGCAVTVADFAGRGDSDWLPHALHYTPLQYAEDVNRLIDQVIEPRWRPLRLMADLWHRVHIAHRELLPAAAPLSAVARGVCRGLQPERPPLVVIGTSLGGLVGMMLAAQLGSRVDYLVLNDVGPMVPGEFLASLQERGRREPAEFESVHALRTYARELCKDLGPLSHEDRRAYLAAVATCDENGCRFVSDRAIFDTLLHLPAGDLHLWTVWSQVLCPTLVLRGERSPVLTEATARLMAAKSDVVEIAGVGHAPSLLPASERRLVWDWLRTVLQPKAAGATGRRAAPGRATAWQPELAGA